MFTGDVGLSNRPTLSNVTRGQRIGASSERVLTVSRDGSLKIPQRFARQ
jgi:hypothetical protein